MSTGGRRVVKYRRPFRLHIGIIVFLFVFIYLIVTVLTYASKKHISFYEVTEKNIADDNTCKAVAIREEKIVTAPQAGYVNYYAGDRTRVYKGAPVYTIDESGSVYDELVNMEGEQTLTPEDEKSIRADIAAFKKSYRDSAYGRTRDFKYDIDNTVLEIANSGMLDGLDSLVKQNRASGSFHIEKSGESGIVTYSTDGLESLTADTVTADIFLMEDYTRTQLRDTKGAVEAGAPVYKIVPREEWSLVLSLSEEQYRKLTERESSRIYITFVKDGLKTAAEYTAYEKEGSYFARLDLHKYMIRYLDDRFLEVELNLNSARGLKIPVSAILEQEFYAVPKDYYTQGGNSSKKGILKEVYKKNGDVEFKFMPEDIYFEDEEFVYLDKGDLEKGDWIRNPETQERYQIEKTETLSGVFNVNQGYFVFRRIEVVYENEEYCIVKPQTEYGLSAYDHIVADADAVTEEDLVR